MDLPCLGWEGVVGYTIIFLNIMIEIVKENRSRITFLALGFLGTLLVNLFRLALILGAGVTFGAPAAEAIHNHGGDFIFLLWILAFLFLIDRFTKNRN